ncbi:cysteine-rich with EGF-like domain protein 2 [Nymphalis io]|uniref:cysteine-rich with EGF-like domain protein 2 n=1 Tax=Inachis io TaxID=171585 RepID=UPI00216913F2|nr:cysteine-rich with EGF-like domain protein 2 [Nymphalis io]
MFYSVAYFTLLKFFLISMPTISYGITRTNLDTKEQLHTKKINECQRCKVVTDSFSNWLEETSRGKHEGGDAAWEEAKLKSYARSEMRLVEIQESLCSELKTHQDDCYALSEEAESLLEKWWFHEYQNDLDLYTWLCIENLKYCCPANHYGESCTLCPNIRNNKICGGNGKCDGDGTRKGDGRCICKRGFTGTDCDECSHNFYNASKESCKPCHKACDGCHGDGIEACVKCADGWTLKFGKCIDNNECLDLSICKSNEYCINKEGTFVCKLCDKTCKTCEGAGPSSCTTCSPNHVLWIGKCIDVKFQRDLLINCSIRIAFYLCLVILVMFLFRKSKSLASLTVLIISILIYYSETTSAVSLIKIIPNIN